MTGKNDYIDVETYQRLQNMALALVGYEDGSDLAQDAALTTLIIRDLYPNKPLINLLAESLGVNYARLSFKRLHEEDEENSPKQNYKPINVKDKHKKIIHRNFDGLSDLEKLVALKLLRESDPNKVAKETGVDVSCINAYIAVINYKIKNGAYK